MILHLKDSISVLDPASQGQTLTEKAVDVHLVQGEDVIARWFHSPNDCDLMVWCLGNGELSRFQLNSAGQITDWCESEGLQTGLIVEIEFASSDRLKSSARRGSSEIECAETIQFDSELNAVAVQSAKELIANATALRPATRASILELLERPWPTGRKARANSSRTRFWGRFKRWTTGT